MIDDKYEDDPILNAFLSPNEIKLIDIVRQARKNRPMRLGLGRF